MAEGSVPSGNVDPPEGLGDSTSQGVGDGVNGGLGEAQQETEASADVELNNVVTAYRAAEGELQSEISNLQELAGELNQCIKVREAITTDRELAAAALTDAEGDRARAVLELEVATEARAVVDQQSAELDQRANDLEEGEHKLGIESARVQNELRGLDEARGVVEADRAQCNLASATNERRRIEATGKLKEAREVEERLQVDLEELASWRERAQRAEAKLRAVDIEQVEDLQRQVDELKDRPTQQALNSAERRANEADQIIRALEDELQDERDRRAGMLVDATDPAVLAAERDGAVVRCAAAEEQVEAYAHLVKKLERDLRLLRGDVNEQVTAFPRCYALDGQQHERDDGQDERNLQELFNDIAARMRVGNDGKTYNYEDDVIRSALAGLAATRLFLFEGQSGTGKSTMVRRIANALGAAFQELPVQPGWQDSIDLLGSYNRFHREYNETDFLVHMYESRLEINKDRFSIVLLDEANLSHVEYYFAAYLSILETTEAKSTSRMRNGMEPPSVHIATGVEGNIPMHFSRSAGAVELPLAPNVWFFCTGNEDDTVKSFSPKFYDRSHVVGLDSLPGGIGTGGAVGENLNASAAHFLKQCSEVGRTAQNRTDVAIVRELVNAANEKLRELQVGTVGFRHEEFIRDFAPPFIAMGGSPKSAADEIIASRLLAPMRRTHGVKLSRRTDPALKEIKIFVEGHDYTRSKAVLAQMRRRFEL